MIHAFDQENRISTGVVRTLIKTLVDLDFHEIVDGFIGDFWGISRGLFLSVLFCGMLLILSHQIPNLPRFAFEWIVGTSPLWVLPAAAIGAWKVWVWYARATYIHRVKPLLLEVKFPRDIVKSPRAMETALTHMWTDSGETTFYNRIWQGQVRPFFSFEIASFGGELHFYIWCWRNWRAPIEATMYAQYPEIEIHEVEDYASKFQYDPKKHVCFCTDWRLEPRNDAYQLRSYIDYELDTDPKEEYKIDPLAQVLESMTSIKPQEQVWLQIVITSNKDVRRKPKGAWFETESRYVGLLSGEIQVIRKQAVGDVEDPGESWRRSARVPQFRQGEQVKSIDRNMGKLPFNVGARGVYISDPENFASPGYTGIRWIWRPMGNPQWGNQMRPRRWHNPFDYPWQDLWDMRWNNMTRRFFDCYRRRAHFYSPWIFPHNMMSTEAIATLWHPPSRAISAPGLERIPAKKAQPPANLPK